MSFIEGKVGINQPFYPTKAYSGHTFYGTGTGTDAKAFFVMYDTPANGEGEVQLSGNKLLPKTASSLAINFGDTVYVADGQNTVNKTAASRFKVGTAVSSSAANSDDKVWVALFRG